MLYAFCPRREACDLHSVQARKEQLVLVEVYGEFTQAIPKRASNMRLSKKILAALGRLNSFNNTISKCTPVDRGPGSSVRIATD
jgi:hypothetical protein